MKRARKPVFDPKAFLAKADGGRTISKYRKDQIVFSQGEAADAVFYIQQGKIKITVLSEQGKEAVVAILGKGDFFGEGCLAGQLLRMASTTTMMECEIMRLEKAAIIRVLHEEPAFSEMFMSHLLTRNIRVEADLVDQLFNSSEKRLARALLLLANFGKEGKPEPVVAKISQETLAEMIGTTRSRVSSFMNKFRQLGFETRAILAESLASFRRCPADSGLSSAFLVPLRSAPPVPLAFFAGPLGPLTSCV